MPVVENIEDGIQVVAPETERKEAANEAASSSLMPIPSVRQAPIEDLTFWKAFKKTTKSSSSLIVLNVLTNGVSFSHSVMLARIDEKTLAASSLILACHAFIFSVGAAGVSATGIIISRAKDNATIDTLLKKGILAGLILSVPTIGLVLGAPSFLRVCGIDKSLTDIVQSYFNAYSWGVPFSFLFLASQQVPLATGNIAAYGISTLSYVATATGLAYPLIFTQRLGAAGLGYAFSISSVLNWIGLNLYLYFSKKYKTYGLKPFSPENLFKEIKVLLEILKLGLPYGMQTGFELLSFPITSIMIGALLDEQALSSFLITMQCLIFAFAPLSAISQVCGVSVGSTIKEENYRHAKLLGNSSIAFGVGISSVFLALMCTIPTPISSIFIDIHDPKNAKILEMNRALLAAGGVRMVFDALRLISGSALQGGFKDSMPAMVLGLLGACVFGLPAGYALTIPVKMGVSGMLVAGDIGIGLAGAALFYRWHKKITNALQRVASLETPLSRIRVVTNSPEDERLVAAPQEAKVPLPQPLLLSSGAKMAVGSQSLGRRMSETHLPEQDQQQQVREIQAPSRKSRCASCVIL